MHSKVQKWGNSLAVRIPMPYALEIGLARNTDIEITVQDGSLLLTPVIDKKESLTSIMEKINEQNIHREVDYGKPLGNEIW